MSVKMARTARLGKTYQIGDDGWWGLSEGVPILKSDKIVVVDITELFVSTEVHRDGQLLGRKDINQCFFDDDFDLVEQCERTESPCTTQTVAQGVSPYTTWAK